MKNSAIKNQGKKKENKGHFKNANLDKICSLKFNFLKIL